MLDKCIECSETANDVSNCKITTCPLHQIRMNKAQVFDKNEVKLLKRKCMSCCLNQIEEVRLCASAKCPLHEHRSLFLADKKVEK
jgi:hypothetical protein